MSANLPLVWADKKNSSLLADFIAKHGAEYCMTAEEINQLRDAVNEMAVVQQSVFMGSVVPADTPTGTGARFWFSVIAGTYTSFGGVVVAADSLALITVTAAGAFSISQTSFDISSKVNVSDVINALNSTETTKPLSANQGRILDLKIAQGIPAWTAKSYLSGDEVNHLGIDWVSNAAIISTDIPGTSSKWVDRLAAKANVSDIVDSLNSSETQRPLSANQGRVLDLKIAQGIPAWTAKSYLSGDEVNHLGIDWVSNAAIISTDIPGTSSKWVDRLAAKANNIDLNGGTFIPVFSFTTIGGINVTNGADATSVGQRRTGYIEINGAATLNYANLRGFEGTTFSMLYLYDASFVGITSIVANNTSGTIRTGSVDIKNTYPTARYYRMALNSNPGFLAAVTTSLIYLGSIGTLTDNIARNAAAIVENSNNIASNLVEINKLKLSKSVKKNNIYTENILDSGNVTVIGAKTQPNLYNAIVSNLPNPVFRGSSPLIQRTGTYPNEFFLQANVRRFTSYVLEFNFTGSIMEIAGRETSYTFTLLVNGVVRLKNRNSVGGASDAQGKCWTKVDFGETLTNAHIRLVFFNAFGGIATDGIITSFTASRPKIICEGDSIFEGSAGNASSSAPNIYGGVGVASYLLDCDLYLAAVGGSGFVALGNAGEPNILNRFEEYVQPFDCDIFLIGGGLNDGYVSFSQTALDNMTAYALKVWNAYKNTTTKVVWISPFQPLNATKANSLGINAMRTRARELCLQYRWSMIDIMDGITYDEIGNTIQDSSATLGGIWDNGRKATMNFDGTHPNTLGHNYLGYRIASEVYKLLK